MAAPITYSPYSLQHRGFEGAGSVLSTRESVLEWIHVIPQGCDIHQRSTARWEAMDNNDFIHKPT